MSGPAFTFLIRNRIHECAPDHSIETISVGALREAAVTMQELYNALDDMIELARPNVYPQPDKPDSPYGRLERARNALAKARGDQ